MNGQNGSADNLIVDRDKKLFHELKEKILLKEPALYIGMAKIGRYYLFSAAKKYLQNCPVSGYEIIIQDQFSLDELEDTTTMLKQLQKPVILCVNLSVAEDISEFINILFRLRKERGESFLFYIFGTVKNVCTALSHPSKEIFHYLSPL